MSRLAFTSPLDRREVAEEIFHSPYIGDSLTSDGDPNSGGVSVLSRATVASAQSGEATAGFGDTSMPLEFSYASDCQDTFSVTLRDLLPHVIYALDIASAKEGPWSPWVYFSMDNASAEEASGSFRTVTLNNDYNGVKWFRARKTSGLAVNPSDQIIASPAVPLASLIPAPVITISGLTDITDADSVPSTEGDEAYVPLAGAYDMPLSVIEVTRFPFPDTAYYRFTKKYAGKMTSPDTWADLNGVNNHFKQPVIASGAAGTITTWTRDGSDPTVNTVIQSLDGQTANCALHRSDFGLVIKARSYAGGCQSPLTMVAVDKAVYELQRFQALLRGKTVTGACDLPRMEQVYGYTTDLLGTHWGPLEGQFQIVQSGNSCDDLWGGPGNFENHEKLLSQSGSGATSGLGGFPLIHNVQSSVMNRDDFLGWTNHIVAASGFVISDGVWERPSGYDSLLKAYNWFLLASDFPAIAVYGQTLAGIDLFGNSSNGGYLLGSPDHGPADFIGHQLASQAATRLLPDDPANTPGAHQLIRLESIWSCLPYPVFAGNPRDDYWAFPIAFEPAAPPVPPPVDSGRFIDYDDFEAYEDTESAESATLSAGNGFSGNWNVVAWTSLTGLDDFEAYDEGSYSGTLPLAGEGFDATGWSIQDGASGVIYLEDFESYAEQTLNPGVLDLGDGTGFSGDWYFPAALDGLEDFEAFADGYTFPSNAVTAVSSGDSSFIGKWFTSALPVATQTFFDGIGGGVSGLIAQWRANEITGHSDGDALADWPDTSGNAYGLLQTVSGNRPVYKANQINTSLPAVQFVAANSNFFNAPSVLTCLSAADLFMVVKVGTQPPATTAKTGIYKLGGANAAAPTTHFPFTDDNIYNAFMTDTRKSTGHKAGLTAWNLLEVWSAPSDWAQLFNGTSHFSTATNSIDFTGTVNIGADVANGVYLDGYIAEILLFDHKLTTSERSVVKTYVAAKYGLTIS